MAMEESSTLSLNSHKIPICIIAPFTLWVIFSLWSETYVIVALKKFKNAFIMF